MADLALERGLPANLDAERFVLGAVLQDDSCFPSVASELKLEDFSLEKHRRIFLRMVDLHERGERIDRVTVANELTKHRQLESVDGVLYLVSLDDGLPELVSFESYVQIVRDKAVLRQLAFTGQRMTDAALQQQESAYEIAARFGEELAGFKGRGRSELESVGDTIENEGLSSFITPSGRDGVPTGYTALDQMTGGLQRGELAVLAARPSMGKTALALNISANIAFGCNGHREPGDEPGSVAIFSLEMSKRSLILRLACARARVDSQKQRAGFLNHGEKARLSRALQDISGAPLFIDDSASTVIDIHHKIGRLRADHGELDLVVIDYLGLIGAHAESESRTRQLGIMTSYLKTRVAKELHVPVLLLSQLSRAPEKRAEHDHRPILSDLRESGDIEQDADLVAFLFREEMYKPDAAHLAGTAELIVAKNRNGPTGSIDLVWLREFTKFENPAAWAGERGA
ncbi:MAG TPA: replicative DNA helicase [Bryobacteraceae bacterium]|jgi:replicative DNA helicase|nr:replicative DNA helicase [Bryobacteraceae bacterium]